MRLTAKRASLTFCGTIAARVASLLPGGEAFPQRGCFGSLFVGDFAGCERAIQGDERSGGRSDTESRTRDGQPSRGARVLFGSAFELFERVPFGANARK